VTVGNARPGIAKPMLAAWRRAGWILMLCLLGAGSIAAWRWRAEFDLATVTGLAGRYPAAPLGFLALHCVASLLFVPRTFLALVAGLVFGAWWGMLWAALGSVLGATAGFLLARHLHAGLLDGASYGRFAGLMERAERGGWRMVAMIRLVPVIPHSLANYALGLTRLHLGAYAFGSLLGQLPLTIAYVGIGAAGGRAMLGAGDWRREVLWPSLIGVSALALSLLLPAAARRWPRRRTARAT
jgi:uncharacterized membrane protein YdjX (TVP38/TMEM64 family)